MEASEGCPAAAALRAPVGSSGAPDGLPGLPVNRDSDSEASAAAMAGARAAPTGRREPPGTASTPAPSGESQVDPVLNQPAARGAVPAAPHRKREEPSVARSRPSSGGFKLPEVAGKHVSRYRRRTTALLCRLDGLLGGMSGGRGARETQGRGREGTWRNERRERNVVLGIAVGLVRRILLDEEVRPAARHAMARLSETTAQ
jgi:hypothetical protein